MFAQKIRMTFAAAVLALGVVPTTAFADEYVAPPTGQIVFVGREDRAQFDRRWNYEHRGEWRRDDRREQRRFFERREEEWRNRERREARGWF